MPFPERLRKAMLSDHCRATQGLSARREEEWPGSGSKPDFGGGSAKIVASPLSAAAIGQPADF